MLQAFFSGCSLTFGEGFDPCDRYLCYPALVCQKLNAQQINEAKPGNSNQKIFLRAATAIAQDQADLYFVQWSALNRLWLHPGPDSEFFVNDDRPDFSYRDIYFNPRQKKFLCDSIKMLNHDYQNILDLVDYCCILQELAIKHRRRLTFINGLLPWQSDLVDPVTGDHESMLSHYTKSVLDFDHRDDTEIQTFFHALRQQMSRLDLTLWANPWTSFVKLSTDRGPQGHHPGVASHATLADMIVRYLNTQRKNHA